MKSVKYPDASLKKCFPLNPAVLFSLFQPAIWWAFYILLELYYFDTLQLSDKSQEAKLRPSYQTLVLGENYLQDNFDNSRLWSAHCDKDISVPIWSGVHWYLKVSLSYKTSQYYNSYHNARSCKIFNFCNSSLIS